MRCLKFNLPRKALGRLFVNRIRAMIEYADTIYDRLESVRMEAARICTGDRDKVVPKNYVKAFVDRTLSVLTYNCENNFLKAKI